MVYTTASILPFQLCISRSRVGRTERIEKKVNLPDVVVGPQTNPLGDRTVLLLSFGKLLLGTETLVALFMNNVSDCVLYVQYRYIESDRWRTEK